MILEKRYYSLRSGINSKYKEEALQRKQQIKQIKIDNDEKGLSKDKLLEFAVFTNLLSYTFKDTICKYDKDIYNENKLFVFTKSFESDINNYFGYIIPESNKHQIRIKHNAKQILIFPNKSQLKDFNEEEEEICFTTNSENILFFIFDKSCKLKSENDNISFFWRTNTCDVTHNRFNKIQLQNYINIL